MKSEKWTTEKGTEIELNWEVNANDINVWTVITVSVNGKNWKSDGQIKNGNLVITQIGISTALLPVSSEILDEIASARQAAKAAIAENVSEHKDYINRMHEIGY